MIDIIYRFDPKTSEPPEPPVDPADARERLCQGNRDFMGLIDIPEYTTALTRIIPIDLSELGADEDGQAPKQRPFAVVLGCSDARVPTELIFNQACNALFVVRVAGNILGNECLGSIEYAVRHLGQNMRLLVVLGHSGCGAVTAAVDCFLDPNRYLQIACTHSLRSIVDRIQVAVRAGAYAFEQVYGYEVVKRAGYRAALIDVAIALNAAKTAKILSLELAKPNPDQLQVVYGVYHLVNREVNLFEGLGDDSGPALFNPPRTSEEFGELARAMARCPEIARMLG